ncbi:MAG TPA: cysteine desulfurase family protein [Patescibacteria group bacterium]|nr:cysteine desulfurase family protein [Patescibacteria group bacterium]
MQVYLDNAATTKMDKTVADIMQTYFLDKFANPSSIHHQGEEVYNDVEEDKDKVAKILNANPKNLIFTGSASEANNFIIKGIARANKDKGKHIIVSEIEHPCVLGPAKELVKEGFKISYAPVDKKGRIKMSELEKMISDDTLLVSIMTANNEVGTIQDIKKIARLVKKSGAYFHTDAVQAVPYLEIDIKDLGVDFLTLSSHKFHGPKGVGMAYIDRSVKINPLISGGEQNDGLRAGTLDVAGIIGFSKALELAYRNRDKKIAKIKELRDYFLNEINKNIKDVHLNGHEKFRLENNINLRFNGVEGEAILMDLSNQGICVSTGSACSAKNLRTSYVLQALKIDSKYLNSNVRFSLSKNTTKAELDYTVKRLTETVKRLRSFSPIK